MRKFLMVPALFCSLLAPAAEASHADDAWLAWVGCWRPEGDVSDRSLCIVPEGDGIRMVTIVAGRIESESRVVANGQQRHVNQEGCTGTETARWSGDRQRVFINADLNCGNNTSRKSSGIFAMLSDREWASVQSIGTAGSARLHTVRYVETQPANLPAEIAAAFSNNRLARETVRAGAASRLDLGDVREAVAHVEVSVVEGWLTTVGQAFDLDARALIELADAGVPSSVIDVLVAISNPGHFAVREERASERDGRGRRRPGTCYDAYYDPYDPFGHRMGPSYSYGCGGGWGMFPWGGYYGGGRVIVIDRGTTRTRGRVTRDGYESGRQRNTAQPGSTTSPTSTSTTKSSGSSDDSKVRKAKPRDN